MKSLNTAERLRESLGCYDIQMHKMPKPKKRKTVSYGDNLRKHFDKARISRTT